MDVLFQEGGPALFGTIYGWAETETERHVASLRGAFDAGDRRDLRRMRRFARVQLGPAAAQAAWAAGAALPLADAVRAALKPA